MILSEEPKRRNLEQGTRDKGWVVGLKSEYYKETLPGTKVSPTFCHNFCRILWEGLVRREECGTTSRRVEEQKNLWVCAKTESWKRTWQEDRVLWEKGLQGIE